MPAQAAARVQQLVNEIASTHVRDAAGLQGKLQDLHASIAQVETFMRSMEAMLGTGMPRRPGRPSKLAYGPSASRRRGPGRAKGGVGEFPTTAFIIDAVKNGGPEGLRPIAIVKKLQEAAPGHHRHASATVSTTLSRLRERGLVRKTAGGKWLPVEA